MVATIKVENYVCPIVTVALTMLCISNSVDGYTIVNTYYHSYSDSNCGDSCGSIYNNSTNSQSCEGSLVNYEDFYIAIYAVLMVTPLLYYKCVGGKSFLSCLFSWFITIIVSLFINLSSGSISYGGISVTVIYSKNTHTYFILSCVLIPLIGFLLFDEENRNRKNYYEIARLLAEKNMFSCHTIIDDSTHSNNSRNSTGDSYGCHNSYRNNNINTHLSNTNINRTSTVGINRYSSSNLLPSEELKYSCIREFRAILSNVSHDIKSPIFAIRNALEIVKLTFKDLKRINYNNKKEQSNGNEAKSYANNCRFAVKNEYDEVFKTAEESMHEGLLVASFALATLETLTKRFIDANKAMYGIKLVPTITSFKIDSAVGSVVKSIVKINKTIPISLQYKTNMIGKEVESAINATTTDIMREIQGVPLQNIVISSDKNWLKENVHCLLSNAIRYSKDEKEVDVIISSITHDANRDSDLESSTNNQSSDCLPDSLLVEVINCGQFVDNIDDIFEPFVQSKRCNGGTGLGLFALRERVNALNGECGVCSCTLLRKSNDKVCVLHQKYSNFCRKVDTDKTVCWFAIPLVLSTMNTRSWELSSESSSDLHSFEESSNSLFTVESSNTTANHTTSVSDKSGNSDFYQCNTNSIVDTDALNRLSQITTGESSHMSNTKKDSSDFNNYYNNAFKSCNSSSDSDMDSMLVDFNCMKSSEYYHKQAKHEAVATTRRRSSTVGFDPIKKAASYTNFFVLGNEKVVVDKQMHDNSKSVIQSKSKTGLNKASNQNLNSLHRAQFENLRVLVVDDSLCIRKSLSLLLTKVGCLVEIACNGKEALAKIHSFKPEVVVIDVQMPVMDGITATKLIRDYEMEAKIEKSEADKLIILEQIQEEEVIVRPIQIIAMSACEDEKVFQDVLMAGADVALKKPVSIHVLCSVIKGSV